MSEFNYDGYNEGEGNLAWNEFDWQQYLNQNKREIHEFIALYQNAESSFNPFEAIMYEESDTTSPFEINQEESEYEIAPDPYTIHRHPLFIVAKGLTIDICKSWEKLIAEKNAGVTVGIAWKFAKALQEIEYHVNGGIYAIDINEAALAIAHLKNSLSNLNEAMRVANQIGPYCKEELSLGNFENVKMTLFNLRGAIMKILDECREHEERTFE